MPTNRLTRLVAGVLAACLIVSCNVDRTTAPPPPAPDAALVGDLLGGVGRLVGSLLTCDPLPYQSASAVIGPAGGRLRMGPHTLTIPRGALSRNVTITAQSLSDTVASVRLLPEGLRFAKPATLTMSYAHCNLIAGLLTSKRIAYTTDGLRIVSYVRSTDNPLAQKVNGRLDHFSRYAVSY
jgi:hypothetical protein